MGYSYLYSFSFLYEEENHFLSIFKEKNVRLPQTASLRVQPLQVLDPFHIAQPKALPLEE